jgi:hypothetical protein
MSAPHVSAAAAQSLPPLVILSVPLVILSVPLVIPSVPLVILSVPLVILSAAKDLLFFMHVENAR